MAKKKQPKGLGDTIKRVTDSTGILLYIYYLVLIVDVMKGKLNSISYFLTRNT